MTDKKDAPHITNAEIAPGVPTDPKKRAHRATYATDKRAGGYLVRVEGPRCERFAGRTIPVTMKSGAEHLEKLARLIWAGKDNETGTPVALYKFEPRPRETQEAAF